MAAATTTTPSGPLPATPPGPSAARRAADFWRLTFLEGGPGQCVFPINNACNAGCGFCGFNRSALPRADWRFVGVPEAVEACRVLYRNGVHYLVVTGGEPMMHPGHLEIIRGATRQGMTVLLVTNGSLLTPEACRSLKDAGVSSMFISVDAADAAAHERNRGLPKVCERMARANAELARLGVQSTASVTMSRLLPDYEALPPFLRSMGFKAVTFSYPLVRLGSSFLGYADSALVDFRPEELDAAFESIKALKRDFHVVNPTESIDDMRRFLRGEAQRFECLGGFKYFYLDWALRLWRCHHWETPMGSVFDMDDLERVRDGCQKCMIDCMRDPSVMQHVSVALSDAVGHAREGRLGRAAGSLVNARVGASLRAVAEQARWIWGL